MSPANSPTGSVAAGEARLLEILTGMQQNQQVLTELLRSQQEGRESSSSSGLAAKDLSKVLKHPTSFSCQTRDEELVKWPAWAWEFEQYLGTLDKSFQVDFKRLKDNAKTVVDFSVLTETEKDRSRIMYGLLASLLNDRLKRLLKTVGDNNGYEAYRLISLELRPSSRTRALALMQTIHNWPVFDSKQGLLAQVVRLEQAMAEYDSIASQAMSDDQRVVSLLRCLTGQLRQHVNLTMEDSWCYAELRSLVARYDASSSKWGASVAAAYGLTEGKGGVLINAAPASSEAVPMEIDRLSKGKPKGGKDGKGKPKGKFDKGKKGKGDAKGKKGDKTKPYSPNPNPAANKTCHNCGRKGHFARDCRQSRVRQVEEATDGSASASTDAVPKAKPAAKTQPSAKVHVRRVAYNLDDYDEAPFGEIRVVSKCDNSDDEVKSGGVSSSICKALSFCARTLQSRWCVSHNASPSDASDETEHAEGMCQQCADEAEHAKGMCQQCVAEPVDWSAGSVRMIRSAHDAHEGIEIEVIVDSGADASCLPQSLSTAGVCSGSPVEFFQDAQGNPLKVQGTRRAELSFGSQPSITETFLVAPHITTPLLAVGKLYRAGFSMQNENGNLSLRSPSGEINIPLYLKQNSLAAKLHVRVIRQDPATVRALTCTVETLALPDYFVQVSADVFGMHGYGNRFVDVTMALPQEGCSFRTTLVKAPYSDEWEILEWCESIVNVDELSALLPGGESREMIVFATRRVVPPEELGVSIGEGEGQPPSPGSLPSIPAEDADILESEHQQHGAAAPDQQAELEVDGALHDEAPVADDGSLVVDGTTLSMNSTLAVLRQAAQSLGLGRSGGKSTVLKRIKDHLTRQSLIAAHLARQHLADSEERVPVEQRPVAVPSDEERRRHCLTHTPYREWCEHCVSFRARSDRHELRADDRRASSVFCFDFAYTSRSDKDEKLCCLVAHDSETKWVQAWPVQSKGGTSSRNFMAVEVTKLLSYLGHRRVTLRADPEPSCTALANAIQALRHRIGMETHIEQTPVGELQSNHAEGAIERIRQLVGTILAELEEKLQVKIKTSDPLHHWCWRHAGWILQRFGVTQNLTPWERVHAAPYGGKLVRFAECVLARVKTATKGKPRWLRAMWLGKSDVSDCLLVCTSSGRLVVARSVRRTTCAYDPSLVGALRDTPDQHVSFLAGRVGASRNQLRPKPVESENLGSGSQVLASDPPSENEALLQRLLQSGDIGMSEAAPLPDLASSSDHDRSDAKRQRIRAVNAHHHSDEVVCLEDLDLGSNADLEDVVEEPLEQPSAGNFEDASNIPKELWRPFGAGEPQLAKDELALIDGIAESFELSRLEAMGVLERLPEGADLSGYKRLSTKMVKSWRIKPSPSGGGEAFLRRARFVAREFKWLSNMVDSEVFAPASSNALLRVLPAILVANQHEHWIALSLDVADAYLTVPQTVSTIVSIWVQGEQRFYRLLRNLPGQRAGAKDWFDSFQSYLIEQLSIDPLVEAPALFRIPGSSDEGNGGGGDCVRAKYKCTIAFLEGGTLPLWTQLSLLDETKSGIYRKCIGVLLYVSSDYPAAQFAIKTLSSLCGKPNEGAWKCLRHLVNYMFHHDNHISCLKTEGKGVGLVVRDEGHTLEVFADADWAGNKSSRKSTSAGCIAFNGMMIHSFSRSQSCISLSSGESEYVACVSAVCDGILLRTALQHVLQEDVSMHVFTDSSAARGIMSRQGCGRLRHISGRLLWLQDFLFKWKKASLHAVPTSTNPADLFTKSLSGTRIRCLSNIIGVRDASDNFSLVGAAELEEQRRRDQAKRFLRAVKSTGRGNAEALQLLTMLIQLVGSKAAVSDDRAQFEPLHVPVSDFAMSGSSAGSQPGDNFVFFAVTAGIAIVVGRIIANSTVRAFVQQAEQPLLAELPVEQPRAPLHGADDASSDDDDDLSLGSRDPRERAAILGITPPQTPPESDDSSEQPDSEPGDYGPDDDGNQELVELFAAVGEAAAADVLPALPLEPLQIRDDADIWIAPISGTRFHLRPVCHGLRQASRIRRLTYGQMQNEYPGRFDMCYYCQEWTRELANAHDVGTLATVYRFLHFQGQQVQQQRQVLAEPEAHDDT
ncbi:Retrovirus-related Pol polyprotein from transposon TNT 1-94 [Symbiodinium microadriaticum]|uniref:Retrovirus-related Pol polyprotein from transposon TNT 1-94 n=1 Tax=Symbiodinium microadriaticum TaxID=2951 RepID=A0A1Q9C124_SYMMI|nr:Retrovirus-related Pol polyprotein from transposon TNT 1-94 [Symbiodinium microadriaticum]